MGASFSAVTRSVFDYLRTSLWVIPALLTGAAVALAAGLIAARFSLAQSEVWWLHSGDGRDASALVGVLLSSMITLMTLVVSITVVVLTLAANQLGPRLIRSFVSDRRTQFSLGTFIATIAYLMLVLRSLDGDMTDHAVPHVAVTVGSALSLLCVLVLLFFVHHLTRSIVADEVIQRVGAEVEAYLDKWSDETEPPGAAEWRMGDSAAANLGMGGYVQFVDTDHLIGAAKSAGAAIQLSFRPGDHLLPKQSCLRVAPSQALTKALKDEIAHGIVVGNQRTTTQDMEFGFRQLVEIALRALSPSMNDPFTAIAAIDRLARLLAKAIERVPAVPVHRDEAGVPRLYMRSFTFPDLLEAAYGQIVQASEGKREVLGRMLGVLGRLAERARSDEHRSALRRQARRVLDVCERTIFEEEDISELARQCEHVFASLEGRPAP